MAISVFTHLPEKGIKNWLQKLNESLNPGGAILFTINNIRNCEYAHNGSFFYTVRSEDAGFSGVADRIRNEEEYGTAFISHDHLKKLLEGLEAEISFHEDFPAYQEAVLMRKK